MRFKKSVDHIEVPIESIYLICKKSRRLYLEGNGIIFLDEGGKWVITRLQKKLETLLGTHTYYPAIYVDNDYVVNLTELKEIILKKGSKSKTAAGGYIIGGERDRVFRIDFVFGDRGDTIVSISYDKLMGEFLKNMQDKMNKLSTKD